MTNLFQTAGYGTENNFENINSKHHLELILKSYIESMNKYTEDIGNNWPCVFWVWLLSTKRFPFQILLFSFMLDWLWMRFLMKNCWRKDMEWSWIGLASSMMWHWSWVMNHLCQFLKSRTCFWNSITKSKELCWFWIVEWNLIGRLDCRQSTLTFILTWFSFLDTKNLNGKCLSWVKLPLKNYQVSIHYLPSLFTNSVACVSASILHLFHAIIDLMIQQTSLPWILILEEQMDSLQDAWSIFLIPMPQTINLLILRN